MVIYGLIDPRDDNLFYIGKSQNGLKQMKRHMQQSSLKRNNKDKCEIIESILSDGLNVNCIILDTARNARDLAMKERIWIAKYKQQLTNKRVG